ncbi:PqqD family protein [Streptomyces hainanensis]|uniref:PqqD family protein n=1 Tax=Streptomyces hainanensis TaxID=402648 RepID=A0A4R4TCV3_9ACTN|nr:PqqD family protein [Streptomyces hainanensis]TDC73374.1 PqqD family protein [Streptomyces hainanensis]
MRELADRAHPALTLDGGAILDEWTGQWHELSPAASVALLLLGNATPEQAAANYASHFGIPAAQATADIAQVHRALDDAGLLAHTKPAAPARGRRRWRWWR